MKTTNLMHPIQLVLGDWSNDGHGQTDTLFILSNLSSTEIEAAYKRGTKILGFDMKSQVAADYEDSKISETKVETFKKAGFVFSDSEWDLDGEGDIWLDSDCYAQLWLFVVKLGAPTFEYEIQRPPRLTIGGCGLFS